MSKSVLFLCTGNYYRSRFAEILFNYLAPTHDLDWRADSRGLKIGWPGNVGPISPHTRRILAERQIACPSIERMPAACDVESLNSSTLVIALKESEHRPMLIEQFPQYADRVEYWHIHDLDLTSAEQALAEIEQLAEALVTRLKSNSR